LLSLGRCNSFVPGTKVLMSDGNAKPIEMIRLGDKVLAADPKSGTKADERVVGTIIGSGEKELVDLSISVKTSKGKQGYAAIVTTGEHPFYVPGVSRWVNAVDLRPGQKLQTAVSADQATVARVWSRVAAAKVHNLTISNLHTYYVLAGQTPVLVHNADEACVIKQTMGAGPFAKAGVALVDGNINAPGVKQLVNEAGDLHGCHMCGARTPGTKLGNWVRDHQPATSLAGDGPQTAYPQCKECMHQQGGVVRQLVKETYDFDR
jgi:hypothetical protein